MISGSVGAVVTEALTGTASRSDPKVQEPASNRSEVHGEGHVRGHRVRLSQTLSLGESPRSMDNLNT